MKETDIIKKIRALNSLIEQGATVQVAIQIEFPSGTMVKKFNVRPVLCLLDGQIVASLIDYGAVSLPLHQEFTIILNPRDTVTV